MGRFIVSSGINPPTTNIKVNVLDPILPDAGALMLIDPMHPSSQWASGVPASATVLENIAIDQASAVLPGLTSTELSPVMTIGSGFVSDGNLLERSTKGGLHFARKAAASNVLASADIGFTTAFKTGASGLALLTAHHIYVSLWARMTYASDYSSSNPLNCRFGGSWQMFGFFTRTGTGDTVYPTDSRRIGYRAEGATNLSTTLAPLIQNVEVSSFTTNATCNAAWSGISASGREPSFVFYRFYMEDLTESGRSYADVDAIDYEMFTRDVKTDGGRYYGDTFTNPATL